MNIFKFFFLFLIEWKSCYITDIAFDEYIRGDLLLEI